MSGVTSLGAELFVVRTRSPDIEVYDASSLQPLRRLPVPQLGSFPMDLTACAKNRLLYVTDYKHCSVHRVEPTWKGGVLSWPVAKWPNGVSVNSDRNVLVTCGRERKLQIFSPHGELITEVSLSAELRRPQHAVQLSSGTFVVTQHDALQCVCIVDSDGQIRARYHGSRGFGAWRERRPAGLAISRRGRCILVADGLNNTVVAMDPTLSKARVLPLPLPLGEPMNDPRRLYVDERAGKLFVAEGNGGRVLVFDNFRKLQTLF